MVKSACLAFIWKMGAYKVLLDFMSGLITNIPIPIAKEGKAVV